MERSQLKLHDIEVMKIEKCIFSKRIILLISQDGIIIYCVAMGVN